MLILEIYAQKLGNSVYEKSEIASSLFSDQLLHTTKTSPYLNRTEYVKFVPDAIYAEYTKQFISLF